MTTSPFYTWEYETQVIGDGNDDSNNTAVKEEKIVSSIFEPLTLWLDRCFTCITHLHIILTNPLRQKSLPLFTEQESETQDSSFHLPEDPR